MRVGFFDSGLGGLSVLNHALKVLPKENFLYYADVKNVPYGNKSREDILKYSEEAIDFLVEHGSKAVVIACNTATSAGAEVIRRKYPDIPIIGIEPAVKPAILKYKTDKRILLLATNATIEGEKLETLINKYDTEHRIDKKGLKNLAQYAEDGIFDKKIILPYLKEELKGYTLDQYGILILGCTHYIFFKDSFRELIDGVQIIDGGRGTAMQLKRRLEQNGLLATDADKTDGEPRVIYFESGVRVTDRKKLETIEMLNDRFMNMEML
ncbi:glutamate racemase [Howardella ureilytica]